MSDDESEPNASREAAALPERRPARLAAALVIPVFLLAFAWAFSNPPGAAPDEADHLVKALGTAGLHVGTAAPRPPADAPANVTSRNESITRIYPVPARLVYGALVVASGYTVARGYQKTFGEQQSTMTMPLLTGSF